MEGFTQNCKETPVRRGTCPVFLLRLGNGSETLDDLLSQRLKNHIG